MEVSGKTKLALSLFIMSEFPNETSAGKISKREWKVAWNVGCVCTDLKQKLIRSDKHTNF